MGFEKIQRGKTGEETVAAFLRSKGYVVIDRNIREKFAEIDIIAQKENTIVFVEVRTRSSATLGHPLETIGPKKINSIRRMASLYLAKKQINNAEVRFDVASIVWNTNEFIYLENAF